MNMTTRLTAVRYQKFTVKGPLKMALSTLASCTNASSSVNFSTTTILLKIKAILQHLYCSYIHYTNEFKPDLISINYWQNKL